MEKPTITTSPDMGKSGPGRRARPLKELWKSVRKPLARSRILRGGLVVLFEAFLRFTKWTNRRVEGSADPAEVFKPDEPVIAVLWHGQHLFAPCLKPRDVPIVAMFSRSTDAELNAHLAQRFGFDIVRGSGGRDGPNAGKGGAAALIALKKYLDRGISVSMIADIPHGKPREAGHGVVTLARLSGCPVIPLAVTTSRRKVLGRTWDKTTLNLPFGRFAAVAGEPVHVGPECTAAELEEKRNEVTAALNAATDKARHLVDGAR